MRPDAYFINPARGRIVDETALAELLNAGRIAGAAIDVFSDEPDVGQNPLLSSRNTIVTPHIGGHTAEAYAEESMGAVEAVASVARGALPKYIANPGVLKTIAAGCPRWAPAPPAGSSLTETEPTSPG